MRRPIAVSLFAGAGGMCLGFEQAGFDVPVAIEIDPVHAATHKLNFPHSGWVTLNSPVELCTGPQIKNLIGDRPVDVVIGGPPCQGFSIAGKREKSDSRSSLLREFVRLVAEIKPKYFVLENVKGLTQGHCREVLEEAIAQFKALGYTLPDWKILNAKNYGVPQNRERLFLLGARHGLPVPSYPAKHTKGVTVEEAIADIPNIDDDYWWLGDGRVKVYSEIAYRSPYAKQMRALGRSLGNQSYPRRRETSILYNCQRTQHSDEVRARFRATAPGTKEAISRFTRLRGDGVAPTLRAGTGSDKGSHTAPRSIHHRYARCITVREMARLSGFPDWFRFHDSIWRGAQQIGNAVPPPLAHAIALEIFRVLNDVQTLHPRPDPLPAAVCGDELPRPG